MGHLKSSSARRDFLTGAFSAAALSPLWLDEALERVSLEEQAASDGHPDLDDKSAEFWNTFLDQTAQPILGHAKGELRGGG